jgi:hypothetical protein
LESKFGKIWTPANGFGCRGSKDGATCAHLYLIFRDVREPLSSRPPPSKSIARVAEECSWVNATSSRRAGVSPVPSRRHSSVPCAGFLPPNAAARERASNPQAGFEMGYTERQRKIVAKPTIAVAALILAGAASASAQKLTVKIIDRQDKEDTYDYAAVYNNVAVGKSFKVHGATFTLQLPDGRLAIVNCESKFAEHMAGRVGNRRSCRTPLVDSIEADFNGDNAKLIWPVSLDGKKMQSETYKILGILDRPKSN